MKVEIRQLWLKTACNMLISTFLFGVLFAVLYVVELLVPSLRGVLLKFSDTAFCIGIPASIIGVGYVLSIRNPVNYTGFFMGILMSVLLGVQMFLLGDYTSTFLYICVFAPFQIMSIRAWTKTSKTNAEATESLRPKFLETKQMLVSLFVFAALMAVVYLLETFVFGNENVLSKVLRGALLASVILANFWLIYKKIDSWIYWTIYSIVGIVIFTINGNIFNVVLFFFFLIINGMAGISWIKMSKIKE